MHSYSVVQNEKGFDFLPDLVEIKNSQIYPPWLRCFCQKFNSIHRSKILFQGSNRGAGKGSKTIFVFSV
jgi:hypothetical protein